MFGNYNNYPFPPIRQTNMAMSYLKGRAVGSVDEVKGAMIDMDGQVNVFPDFDYAAVACGIAEIGFSGLVLTPKYGSRQRFHMIITDAELEPTPLLDQSVCDRCGKCADSCPLGAIDREQTEEIDICGKKMTVAKIDYDKCRSCKNGACANRFAAYAKPDRVAALCNRTCLAHLEEQDLLENRFHESFRKRDAWVIGENKSSADAESETHNVLGGAYSKGAKK